MKYRRQKEERGAATKKLKYNEQQSESYIKYGADKTQRLLLKAKECRDGDKFSHFFRAEDENAGKGCFTP